MIRITHTSLASPRIVSRVVMVAPRRNERGEDADAVPDAPMDDDDDRRDTRVACAGSHER